MFGPGARHHQGAPPRSSLTIQMQQLRKKKQVCFHSGSNRGSFACEANGLTNFPMEPLAWADAQLHILAHNIPNIFFRKCLHHPHKTRETQGDTAPTLICKTAQLQSRTGLRPVSSTNRGDENSTGIRAKVWL